MRVAVYTQLDPMGYYRLVWPAMVLQSHGYDVDIFDGRLDTGNPFRMVEETGEFSVPDYDVIVMNLVTEQHRVDAIKVWQRHGKRVVVDYDDDLTNLTATHNPGAYDILHRDSKVSARWVSEACRLADCVTVSTAALRDLYGGKNGVLLRNCVPSAFLKVPRYKNTDTPIIGWTGALQFRLTDPQVVGSAIGRLQSEGYRFGTVGPEHGLAEAFNLTRPLAKFGKQAMPDYPLAMSRFHVGISPLRRIKFNYSKSWLKPLEFLALGVPCVVSDMPEYVALGGSTVVWDDSKGVMYARDEREWYSKLKMLLSDDGFREEMSARGRDLVRDLTYENMAGLWWQAWTGQKV